MRVVMRLAALYNASYALLLLLFPQPVFNWLYMPHTPDVMVRCIGMMVGVYAVGYWISASNPLRWWPLVMVGIVGKGLGPIGFFVSVYTGELPWQAGWMNLTSDVIWLPLFIIIVRRAYLHYGFAEMRKAVW
jgi:hypothetical protein